MDGNSETEQEKRKTLRDYLESGSEEPIFFCRSGCGQHDIYRLVPLEFKKGVKRATLRFTSGDEFEENLEKNHIFHNDMEATTPEVARALDYHAKLNLKQARVKFSAMPQNRYQF